VALALVSIDPEHQNEILKTGYEIGQSRVIAGYHYQSDVDAARLAGSAAFARLSSEPVFQELFRKAKAEFDAKK
jgi:acid phosphatase (class A)